MDINPEKKCPECQKTFVTNYALKRHVVSHDPNAKVKCEICGNILKHPAALVVHVRSRHTRRARPSCDLCPRVFRDSTALRDHINNVHSTRERPCFPCLFPNCGKTYRYKCSVLLHVKNEHTENPARFPCTLCGKEFKIRDHLERHILTHTTEKPYKCATCGRSFAQMAIMKKHEVIFHGYIFRCGHSKNPGN